MAIAITISIAAYYMVKDHTTTAALNLNVKAAEQSNISEAQAKKLAAEQTNKAVKEVELEINANGEKVYQVELQDNNLIQEEEDVYINAQTGKIMEKNIKITADQAKEAALKTIPGTLKEIELDDEAGIYYYDMEVLQKDGKEVDIEISAETGKIIKVDNE